MNAAAKKIIDEIDQLLQLSSDFVERHNNQPNNNIGAELYEDLLYFHTRVVFIFQSLKKTSFDGRLHRFKITHLHLTKSTIDRIEDDLIQIFAALKVTKREIEGGLIYNISELAKIEVFSDYLEYGKDLLDSTHHIAAAVIIGSTLENELRVLCEKHGIDTKNEKGKNLPIEPMNEKLGKIEYDLTIQKKITLYGGIRNDAAHGAYEKVKPKDVQDMYDFVLNFRG